MVPLSEVEHCWSRMSSHLRESLAANCSLKSCSTPVLSPLSVCRHASDMSILFTSGSRPLPMFCQASEIPFSRLFRSLPVSALFIFDFTSCISLWHRSSVHFRSLSTSGFLSCLSHAPFVPILCSLPVSIHFLFPPMHPACLFCTTPLFTSGFYSLPVPPHASAMLFFAPHLSSPLVSIHFRFHPWHQTRPYCTTLLFTSGLYPLPVSRHASDISQMFQSSVHLQSLFTSDMLFPGGMFS